MAEPGNDYRKRHKSASPAQNGIKFYKIWYSYKMLISRGFREMRGDLISRVRIELLAECFGISGLGVIINLAFLTNIFLFAPNMIFPLCVWSIAILATTGIAQIILNEIWLTPIIFWLNRRGQAQKPEAAFSAALKLTGFFLICWTAGLAIAIIIVKLVSPLSIPQIGILFAVGIGAGVSFLISWLLMRAWQFRKLARAKNRPGSELETANGFLKFPLKSAGLSFGLWAYAGIGLSLGYYFLVGFSRFECLYILTIAFSTGILAFPFQYLLFKRSLSGLLQIFLGDHPRIAERALLHGL